MDVAGNEVAAEEQNHLLDRNILLFLLRQLRRPNEELVCPEPGDVEVVLVESRYLRLLHLFLDMPIARTYHHRRLGLRVSETWIDGVGLGTSLDFQESFHFPFHRRQLLHRPIVLLARTALFLHSGDKSPVVFNFGLDGHLPYSF